MFVHYKVGGNTIFRVYVSPTGTGTNFLPNVKDTIEVSGQKYTVISKEFIMVGKITDSKLISSITINLM